MKKAISMILAVMLVCLAASACAMDERTRKFMINYNALAKMYGTNKVTEDMLQPYTVNTPDDAFLITFDGYYVIARFEGNSLDTAYVCCQDESASTDFLMTCVGMCTFFGAVDYQAVGVLVVSFGLVRRGEKGLPSMIGSDSFLLEGGNDGNLYSFTYENKDLKYSGD